MLMEFVNIPKKSKSLLTRGGIKIILISNIGVLYNKYTECILGGNIPGCNKKF